jgi:hypothetical protein
MTNNTTKPGYKIGWEAAEAGQPSRSPHRPGTGSEAIWLDGFHAFVNGETPPQEPRKKRTKIEMAEARANPASAYMGINDDPRPLSPALLIKALSTRDSRPIEVRGPGLFEDMIAAKMAVRNEHDPEMRELLYMDYADLDWLVSACPGDKPSNRWNSYKLENHLMFGRLA